MRPDRDDLDYLGFIQDLIEGGRLDGAVLGIFKQAVARGRGSFSADQQSVLEIAVERFVTERCPICHQKIPWPEMYQAIDSKHCLGCKSKSN
jgi:hypothetical protein